MQKLDDIDKECQKLITEINQLQDKLRTLQTHRNQLVPISSLPIETLAEVFSLAQQPPLDDRYRSRGRVTTVLASVCHHWRQVVLSTPFLWNYIDVNNTWWIASAFDRSKILPLTLILTPHNDEIFSNMLTVVHHHLPRFKSLSLRCWSYHTHAFSPMLQRLKWHTAKSLETLECNGIELSEGLWKTGTGPPSLQVLSLTRCRISAHDWRKIPSSPHLKELHLCDMSSSCNALSIIYYLQCTPSLEVLELENALHDVDLAPSPSQKVLLPCLQRLDVSKMICWQPMNFFSGIRVPDTARIDARIEGEDAITPEVLSVIQKCRPTPWDPVTITITMTKNKASLKLYESADAEGSPIFHLALNDTSSTIGTFVERSCTVFTLTNLTTLDIYVDFMGVYVPPTLWTQTFGQLLHLKILKARGDSSPSIVQLLADEANEILDEDEPRESFQFSFPALETLALDGCSYVAFEPDDLILALEIRSRYEYNLERLVLYAQGDHECDEKDRVILWRFNHLADSVEQLLHTEF